jgi:ubiquinone/menaquinone biosynthesis C-methylase UbiE
VLHISYGLHVSDDAELRLCGDPTGKRTLELGISGAGNAVVMAEGGAKAIAVDPDPQRIAQARRQAEDAGVRVEFHQADLADLGFATSASIDLVVAAGTLVDVDDLPRVLRQVHRVLKPECPILIAGPHPVATMLGGAEVVLRHRYGTPPGRSVSDLFMALHRTNFRVDNIQELFPDDQLTPMVPAVLLVRARKLGV